ncbi:MAG: hypothetical protein KAI47_20150 [Deltaproteobacteria bacterium]|nr:hypothetical protein [Deltaproteobacteria bacterium]
MSAIPRVSRSLLGEAETLAERLLDLSLVDVAALIGRSGQDGGRVLRHAFIADLRDALAVSEQHVAELLVATGGSHVERAQRLEVAARLERRTAGVAEKLDEALQDEVVAGSTSS